MSKTVELTFSPIELGKGIEDGAHFEVRDDSKMFARLTVTRKGLIWWGHGAIEPKDVSWKTLEKLLSPESDQPDEVPDSLTVDGG